jgi:hypothetical protein
MIFVWIFIGKNHVQLEEAAFADHAVTRALICESAKREKKRAT